MWRISLETGEETLSVPEDTLRCEAWALKYACAVLLARALLGLRGEGWGLPKG